MYLQIIILFGWRAASCAVVWLNLRVRCKRQGGGGGVTGSKYYAPVAMPFVYMVYVFVFLQPATPSLVQTTVILLNIFMLLFELHVLLLFVLRKILID